MSLETINGLVLANVCHPAGVVVLDEFGGSWSEAGVQIPHADGIRTDDQAPRGPKTIVLKTVLRYASASGTITHADGAAGHIYENLSLIKKALGAGLVEFTRTIPHAGAVRAFVKLMADPFPGEARHVALWPLTIPTGSWQDAAQTSQALASVVTGGDTRIYDPILVIPSAQTITHTHADGLVETIIAGAGPTYPVTVDVGLGTVLDNGAADARGDVTFSQPWKLRLDADGAQTFTGTGTLNYRNRWA